MRLWKKILNCWSISTLSFTHCPQCKNRVNHSEHFYLHCHKEIIENNKAVFMFTTMNIENILGGRVEIESKSQLKINKCVNKSNHIITWKKLKICLKEMFIWLKSQTTIKTNLFLYIFISWHSFHIWIFL